MLRRSCEGGPIPPLLELTDVRKHFPIGGGIAGRGQHAAGRRRRQPDGRGGRDARSRRRVRAAASRRSRAASCACTSRPRARSASTARTSRGCRRGSCAPLRRDLVMVFQDPQASLNPRKRVDEIVGMPLRIHGIASGAALRRRVRRAARARRALARRTPQRYPHEFSGGQRQRIGLARALATNPRLVVCDEPVSALDVSIQAQILNLLRDLQRELRLTLVFIAHDLGVVRHVSDRVAVMYLGRIVELAPVDELYARPVHPYSEALLSAVPVPDPDVRRQRDRARGRRAEPDRPTLRLPVPPALPLRDRAVPRRRPSLDDRRRKAASDRLPPSARSTHRACCAVVSSERAIIEVEGLRKAYGETIALAGVDLEVPAGTVLGLLGPNGAGKTTIVRVLATLLIPDAGHARIDGIDVVERPAGRATAARPRRPVRRGRRDADRPREPRDDRPAVRPAPEGREDPRGRGARRVSA